MAGETNGAVVLESTEHIPIAQLNPEISAPASRAIKAVVTLTWPYSSATGSVAFLLSEPDFRLRRTRGQVRVRFSGSSAKAIAASGIASGDEVIVCLDGVEWVSDDVTVATPGKGIEYELRFTERLLLQFKQEDSEEIKKIDLDHPAPEEPATAPARLPTPEPEQPNLSTDTPSTYRPAIGTKIGDEWSSPAFIKRARTSYGSLFEIDPFAEDDGSVPGKGRKRTRLSTTWRYASRSPTPEVEGPEVESINTSPEPAQNSAPAMSDEGCQTVDFGSNNAAEDVAQALADLSRQATNVAGAAYPTPNGMLSFGQPHSFVHFSENHASEPALPSIRTEAFTQQSDEHEVEPEVPKSPRLHPIPSDSLALVSPLLSTKSNIFSRQNGGAHEDQEQPMFASEAALTANGDTTSQSGKRAAEQPQTFGNEEAVKSNMNASADLEAEDIYSASPAGRREQPESGFSGFQESMVATDAVENAIFHSQFASEHQYGHWQSAGAELSNAASPSRNEIFMEGAHGERFYEGEEVHQENEDSVGASVAMSHSNYPDIDSGLLGHVTSDWGASPVAYPELSGSNDHAAQSVPQPPHPTGMSRSQSVQSAVVDLTESDDEADPESHSQHSRDEYDESAEGDSDEESLEERQQELLADGQLEGDVEDDDLVEEEFESRQASARQGYEDGDEDEDSEADGEGEFEEGEEEGKEEVLAKQPSAFGSDMDDEENVEEFDQDEEDSYDEEEESYHEEGVEYDELPEPRARQEPEVIDLLSSDEEDEAPTRAPAPTRISHTSSPNRHGNDHQMSDVDIEDSEGESELGDEELLPYAERAEIKTSIPGQEADYSSSAPEEEDEDEDEDALYEDDLPENEISPGLALPDGKSYADIDPELEGQVDDVEDEDAADEDNSISKDPFVVSATETFDGGAESIEVRTSQTDAKMVKHGNSDDADQIGTPQDLEPAEMEVDDAAETITTEDSPSNAYPERPSLFSRVFSLDGANDEPRFGASYRSMSKDEAVLPSSTVLQKVFSGPSAEQKINAQLPTPEDTQITRKTVSLENSFSSVNGPQQPVASPADEMDVDQTDESRIVRNEAENVETEAELEAVESSPVADVYVSTETNTTTVEMTETAGMGNFHAEIRTQKVTQISEISPTSDDDRPEESDKSEEYLEPAQEDGKLDSSEHEAQETTVLTEAISKIPIEDHQSTSSRDELQSYDGAGDSRSQPQSEHGDDAAEVPENQIESPRRSTRRTNPTSKAAANAKENVRPVTPNNAANFNTQESPLPVSVMNSDSRSKNMKENTRPVTPAKSRAPPSTNSDNEQSPLVMIDTQATPKGHDASLEVALATSDASSPPQHNLRKLPIADLKLRLTRALRTDFSEFTGLKVIRFHLTQKLDFLAVATTSPPEPQRAKNGPRQYQITFNITDPSIAPSSVTEVQVFRPYKDALPIVKAGDGILLRNFLVMSVQSRGGGPAFALRSTQEDASSWAVFKDDDEVEVRGPPVEYGDAEKNHVAQLRAWYASLDGVAQAKIARANGDKGAAGKAVGKKHSKAL
ncbi:hypothetical protein BKA64DRAFT_126598 [Cadophora sp. MPI-SDFR-AT-0126]|nr:hypothetical protein BKA64DRAFT_126598 [Leotiomycetes sp. MPI-SDFR-AT-0126]